MTKGMQSQLDKMLARGGVTKAAIDLANDLDRINSAARDAKKRKHSGGGRPGARVPLREQIAKLTAHIDQHGDWFSYEPHEIKRRARLKAMAFIVREADDAIRGYKKQLRKAKDEKQAHGIKYAINALHVMIFESAPYRLKGDPATRRAETRERVRRWRAARKTASG